MSPIGEQQRPNKAKSSNGPRQTKYQKGKTKNCAEINHDYTPGSPPAETQNVPSHKIFVFGPADDDLMDIENGAIELTEIRSRNRKDHITRPKGTTRNDAVDELRKIHFIDHDVDPEDSLAKLSLKYGCTITQLKQANNIYNDQELYARKSLKIPVYQHSLIWESLGTRKSSLDSRINQLKELKRSHSESSLLQNARDNFMYERDPSFMKSKRNHLLTDLTYSDDDDDDDNGRESKGLLSGKPRTSNSLNETNNLYEEYLELVDKDIQNVSNKVQSKSEVVNVGGHSIGYLQPNMNDKKPEDKLGNAGWVGYKGILIALCTVAVLVPIMYILYFKVLKKNR